MCAPCVHIAQHAPCSDHTMYCALNPWLRNLLLRDSVYIIYAPQSRTESASVPLRMAQASTVVVAQPRGDETEWKAKLALPPKDTRVRTEVSDLHLWLARCLCFLCHDGLERGAPGRARW